MRIRAFTLLEILLALFILGLIGSVTAIQVKKMIDLHRFEAEVRELTVALQEAQVFSASYETDLALDFFYSGKKLSYRFSTAEPLAAYSFNRNLVSLAHTAQLKVKDVAVSSLHVEIYSGGRIEPQEVVAFCHTQGPGKTLWLDLQQGPLVVCAERKPARVKQQLPAQPKKAG